MRWLPYALTCAVLLAAADFFVKLASDKIAAGLGLLIYGATTFAVGLAWAGYLRATGQVLTASPLGLAYAVGVGLAFSGVTIFLYLTFARVNVSIGAPIIRLTGIILASLLGILLLREPVTWRYALGVALAVCGVVLIIVR
jgi:uncharacterized membrane protein